MNSNLDRRSRERVVAALPVRVKGAAGRSPELSAADSRRQRQRHIPLYELSHGRGFGSGIGTDSSAGIDLRGKMLGLLPCPGFARGTGILAPILESRPKSGEWTSARDSGLAFYAQTIAPSLMLHQKWS